MFYSLTPEAYQKLATYPAIVYGLAPSEYGEMAVAWWPDARKGDPVCYLALQSDLQKATEQLHKRFPQNTFTRDDKRAKAFMKIFKLNGSLPNVLMKGSPFYLQVWKLLYNTKRGTTLTYSELAKKAGRPLASRAVGTAMATNPIALIVPCHRVLGASNNGLGGYGYGLDVKKKLLIAEQRI